MTKPIAWLGATLALALLVPHVTLGQAVTQPETVVTSAAPPPEPAIDPRGARKQRRARMLLAAGVSLTSSALIFTAWSAVAPGPCSYDESRARGLSPPALIGASVFGAIGISLTLGGGFALTATKRIADYPMLKQHRVGAVALGVGVFAVSHALLGIARLTAAGFCAS